MKGDLGSDGKLGIVKVLSSALIAGSFVRAWQQHRRSRSSDRVIAASYKTELLVDADSHSVERIKQAMSLLKDEGHEVETTVFASPRIIENKKWCRLMKAPDITFRPVSRSNDSLLEPNDEAIRKTMKTISARPHATACIALLTQDTGFIDTMVQLQSLGFKTVVLIIETRYPAIGKYTGANIKVLKLQQERYGNRVRAILHSNGDGSVDLADEYIAFDNEAKGKRVAAFLQKLGFFIGERSSLIQPMAKFWFSNCLGSLTVFPQQLATLAVHDAIEAQSDTTFEYYNRDLAYFLPLSPPGTKTKAGLQKYGTLKDRQIFRGGGPFMLQDSPDLTVRALRRLGYLDDNLNNDLTEALFCFLNSSVNKHTLRRVEALPNSGDRSSTVCEKLRAGFLSHGSPGSWQYMRRDETSMSSILLLLRKASILSTTEYLESEVFEAMKMYAEDHGLEAMRTFNGLAFRILRRVNRDPNERSLIEVRR
eukprot:Skav224248  [mRNA]  locus=scaffold939:1520066:1521858:- [translate_table: standard]